MNAGAPITQVLKPVSAPDNRILAGVTSATDAPATAADGVPTARAWKVIVVWRVQSEEANAEVSLRVWVWSLAARQWVLHSLLSARGAADTEYGSAVITHNGMDRVAFQVSDITDATTFTLWAERVVLQ